MTDLVVIVPSRGRPEAAARLARAFTDTCARDSGLIFAVGKDDPTLPQYKALRFERPNTVVRVVSRTDRPSTMNHALNEMARLAAARSTPAHEAYYGIPFAVGFMGDDHRPVTPAWDRMYLDALRDLGTGIVYGDDLLQGERMPTQVAMTADIVRELSFMAPPNLWHMYVDNFWLDLGRAAGCIRYLPGVVVEHLHPLAGKASLDDSYHRSNAAEVYHHDEQLYRQYKACGQFAGDVAKVKALRHG